MATSWPGAALTATLDPLWLFGAARSVVIVAAMPATPIRDRRITVRSRVMNSINWVIFYIFPPCKRLTSSKRHLHLLSSIYGTDLPLCMNPVQGYIPPTQPLGAGFRSIHFLRGLWRVFLHFDVFQKVPKKFLMHCISHPEELYLDFFFLSSFLSLFSYGPICILQFESGFP